MSGPPDTAAGVVARSSSARITPVIISIGNEVACSNMRTSSSDWLVT